MKTTRPVFESFSDFVEYLALNEATSTGPLYSGDNIETLIFSKISTLVTKFGTNFDTMKAEWIKNSKDCYPYSAESIVSKQRVGDKGILYSDYFRAENLLGENPIPPLSDITKKNADPENYIVPKSYKTEVKSYEFLNAVGYRVNSDNEYMDSRVLTQYVNAINLFQFTKRFNLSLSKIPDSWEAPEMKRAYDGEMSKDEAIYKMYWPNYGSYIYNTWSTDSKILISDGNQITVKGSNKNTASLAGLLTAKDGNADNKNLIKSRQSKPAFTKKTVFYTVPSLEIGGGNPYTDIETKTITVPTSETVTETKDYVDSIPLGESAIFAALLAVPKPGMESTVLAAISKVFSQYTTIKSVTVQGSASWEWTDGKTRDDAKNIDLAKKRAEYFVTVINSKSGNKSLAKLSETPGVVQGKDKENEPKESWRKINLKINGTKSSTITVDKDIIEIKDNKVVLRYDKITINEYCLSIELESPGIINSKGWGYDSDERDLKKIEKAKEKKEQWQLDLEAEEKKEKEKAENQTPTPPPDGKTPE